MRSLKQHLEEQMAEVPKRFLRRLVTAKIEEQGIENGPMRDALIEHVLSGAKDAFHWNDGQPDRFEELHIVFTDEDSKRLEDEVSRFFREGLPQVIKNTVQEGAKSFARELQRRWPEQKVEERNQMRHFRDRLELRWSKGLDALNMLLIASREVGQTHTEKLARSRAKIGIPKKQALAILHMRACQTTMEILNLLESGLADGAFARWRTLYEISVVAFVIDRFGDGIAERYLAHDVVSTRETVLNDLRHRGLNYDASQLKGEFKEIEDDFQAALQAYGKSFAGPYGWAASSLSSKSPRFQDLEEAINWKALPPSYKLSSHKVHAGILGATNSLATIGGQPFIHAGASNADLETPAINTAYSLLHVTSLVFSRSSDLEVQIQMQALVLLRDKVARECSKSAKKLEKEELEVRSGIAEL